MAEGTQTDKTLQLLKILAGLGGNKGEGLGLRIAEVKTTEPNDVTLVMAGTAIALDLDIFEVPVDLYPLRVGDKLLAFPLVATDGGRWAAMAKLNGGLVMATMQGADSLQPDGMDVTYAADRLIIPPYFAVSDDASTYTDTGGGTSSEYLLKPAIQPLQGGDRVSIAPTLDGDTIKYVILNKY
jgi:hypothetical protein